MLLCFVVGGQAEKSKDKTTTTKTTQTKSRKAQTSQTSQKSRLQAQQRQLQKNIAANKTKKAELEKKVKEQLEAVLVLGDEINEKQRTIDTIRVSIDSLDAQLLVLEGQLKKLQDELGVHQQRYAQSVRFMHRNNKMNSKMMFIFSAKNVNQMYRRSRFIKDYATYQRAQGEAVKQKQKQVEQKRHELESSKTEKTVLLTRGEREQQSLEAQQNRRQKMADELQKQKKTVAAIIAQQQQEEAELNKRIDQMIAEEIAREQARLEAEGKQDEQALQDQQQPSSKPTQKGKNKRDTTSRKQANLANSSKSSKSSAQRDLLPPSSDAHLSGSFASNKGRLPMPITGAYQVVRGFGSNVVDGARGVHISSKGLYLKGQPGAQARCIFDGEVSKIYATGNSYIVMVRHGRYISVYSDLASISVKAGQKVSTTQTLGKLGPTYTMQFQLRNWTELLNPRAWLKRK